MPEEAKPSESMLDAIITKPIDEIIPWEECILPSRGRYYKDAIPGGVIKVRAMGIYADKILTTQRLAQTGQSINWIYKNCVKLPNGFDVDELLAGDRSFILYYLRGITHGNEYEFLMKCTNEDCDTTFPYTYDLNELSRTIKTPNEALGDEPFQIVLPYLTEKFGKEFKVKVRFLRGSDTTALMKDKKSLKRAGIRTNESINDAIEKNLNTVIVEAVGEKDRFKIAKLVERLHARDTATIREFLNDNSPGIDTIIEIQCPNCSTTIKTDLPITPTFFRPKKSGGNGA